MPYNSINPMMAQQRNAITQALMRVQNPPPRTQMPGGNVGAPTQSPIVPAGVAANPAAPGMPGVTNPMPPTGAPPQPGAQPPGMQQPFAPPPGGSIGAPTVGPPQAMPVSPGGFAVPPQPNVPGLVGALPPPPLVGTQIPQLPGQLGRY